MIDRFSEYQVMWIFVFFDLPTETKSERKKYAEFRKNLLRADVHIKRVKSWLPAEGYVGILMVTDKQFSQMELFHCCQLKKKDVPTQQLELF